jgi:hypothetical protein
MLRSIVGTEGIRPSMHAKLESESIMKKAGATPGPGNYEQSFKNKHTSPAFKLGTEKRDAQQSRTF